MFCSGDTTTYSKQINTVWVHCWPLYKLLPGLAYEFALTVCIFEHYFGQDTRTHKLWSKVIAAIRETRFMQLLITELEFRIGLTESIPQLLLDSSKQNISFTALVREWKLYRCHCLVESYIKYARIYKLHTDNKGICKHVLENCCKNVSPNGIIAFFPSS